MRPTHPRFRWLLLLGLVSCDAILESEDETPRVYTVADGLNGEYSGNWTGGQSDRSQGILTGKMKFTISNNSTLTGDIAPISGSVRAVNGTVNSAGVITATAAADTRGCVVTFNGQVTTSPTQTSVDAAATGSYTLVNSPTCNTNTGSWTITRK